MAEVIKLREGSLDWREVEGEVVVLDGRASAYLAVNNTGALLWRALSEGTDRDGLVTLLAKHAGIDRSVASEDVDRFLDMLASRDLLDR